MKIEVITNLTREVDTLIRDLEADVSWDEKRELVEKVDLPRLKRAFEALPDPLPLHWEA